MSTSQSDPALLDKARRLASKAGLTDARIFPLDRGLSADLFTVHPHLAAPPAAVIKLQRGFAGKVYAEAAALELLGEHKFDKTPRLLLAAPSHEPPALVMTWLGTGAGNSAPRGVDLDTCDDQDFGEPMRAFGRWLAELHDTEVQPGDVKMSSDPLALPDRLLTQATSAVERFERRFGGAEPGLVELLGRARAHLEDQAGRLLEPDAPRRLIHRDLRPDNVLASQVGGEFVGVVDYEHAAAADPAWDFAKLRWWWFDRRPVLEAPFREGYESKRAWPDARVRRLFRIFEATTLVAYFYGRHPDYPGQALLQLRAELDGDERPCWGRDA